jgi:hypothetical protein
MSKKIDVTNILYLISLIWIFIIFLSLWCNRHYMARLKTSGNKPENLEKYLKQYRELAERLNHINHMMEVIGSFSPELKMEIKLDVGSVESATLKALNPSLSKEAGRGVGRLPKWEAFILRKLKSLDKPLSYRDIISEASDLFGIHTEKEVTNALKVVFSTVHRMRAQNQLETIRLEGQREKFVVLRSWCTENGKLKKSYRGKLVAKPGNQVGAKILSSLKKEEVASGE